MGSVFPKNSLFLLKELRRFIRVETGLVITCIGLSGYLIFNTTGIEMVFLLIAMFFGSGANYAYNHLTDRKEDIINNRGLNFFVTSRIGYCLMLIFMIISLSSALHLSFTSFAIYLISTIAGFAYSAFRIKRFPVKTVYSGFFLSIPFLIGATAGDQILADMVPCFLLMFLLGFTGNLLGDVRGYWGDRVAGLKTIPVVLGTGVSKDIVHINLTLFSFFSIVLGYFMFMPMIPLLAATSFFLIRDDHMKARSSMMSTFIILIAVLITMSALGV